MEDFGMSGSLHPIFAPILKAMAPTTSPPLNAALDRLGRSILSKELRAHEAELVRHIDCGTRLMDQMDELMAEARDDATPDYARDIATNKHARACDAYQNHVRTAAALITLSGEIRKRLGKEPHVIEAVCRAYAKA